MVIEYLEYLLMVAKRDTLTDLHQRNVRGPYTNGESGVLHPIDSNYIVILHLRIFSLLQELSVLQVQHYHL